MEELDLHWINEDPDLGIASDGVLCKDMNDIISRITKVKDTVKKINLNSQPALTEIPKIIGECKLLEELNVSHTVIKSIPEFVFDLPNLQFLSCRCIEPMDMPKDLSRAVKLEKFHFRISKSHSFPQEICTLQNLKSIAVDLYSPAALPEKLGTLKKLEKLNFFLKFDETTVPDLPSSFNNHPTLIKLHISDPFYKNRKIFNFNKTAKILSTCGKFESIKFSGISIGKEIMSLSTLKNLKLLGLRHILIEGNIFDAIKNLEKLEKLDLWGSEFKISSMPDIFTNFKGLQSFSFAGNMITDLPPSIYSLTRLKSLEICSTGISSLDENIANLQELENLHVYDNLLEKIPQAIYKLPRLCDLNIEENLFAKSEIDAIKGKIKELEQKGQKIQLVCEGQGHRQMVKKLRTIKNIKDMDIKVYAKHCLNAVKENAFSIKYIDTNKLKGSMYYAELCVLAVRRTGDILEMIDPRALRKSEYFYICMEAAKSRDIGNSIKYLKGEFLTGSEYLQVCMEAALHNKHVNFLENFNNETFMKRFGRAAYEHICWASVLHFPETISKMVNSTVEIREIAEKLKKK
jgi:Leucine-rich repeat (LRR) protein